VFAKLSCAAYPPGLGSKTPSVTDEHYARTRAFYQAMGFRPLEEFKQIWDEANPCGLMVKYLGKQED
jgi:hypothetical protein